jgi:hypothetical protein
MPSSRLITLPALALAMGGLVLSGCSSAKKSTASSTSSTSSSVTAAASTSASASPSVTATPATAAELTKLVVLAADLPTGWKGTPYKDDPASDKLNGELTACLGIRDTTPDEVATAHSEDFSLENASISSQVTSYKNQAAIDSDTAGLSSPKLDECFGKLLRGQASAQGMPAGAKFLDTKVTFTPREATGPQNLVGTINGSLTIQASTQVVKLYLSSALMVGPLIEAEIDFSNVGSPVDAALQAALVEQVAARIAKG